MEKVKSYSREDYINLIGNAIENVTGEECLIIFFGSILDEKRFNRTSDIDVAIYCKGKLTSKEYLNIMERLEQLPILRQVDLIDLKTIENTELLKNIVERGRIWRNIPELVRDLKRLLKSL
jgi:predicted nucleotidyltransferase